MRPWIVVLALLLSVPSLTTAQVGTTFTVNATNDVNDGACNAAHCSLREAISAANTLAGQDTIAFNISGPHSIRPTSALPAITEPVVIDGTTDPSFAGAPVIEIDGSLAGASASGLILTGGNSTVRGLVINRFGNDGILVNIQGGNTLSGNYIGTDVTGSLDLGNGQYGLRIDNAPNNAIGGTEPDSRNLLSGNAAGGIRIQGFAASGNVIRGNYVGTNRLGTADLGNSSTGIHLENASNNIVGGTTPQARNLVSGNDGMGIVFAGSNDLQVTGNVVQGNYIGTDVTGTVGLGNSAYGIYVPTGSSNLIGGTADVTPGGTCTGSCNLVAANGIGIWLSGDGNVVEGNYIGVNVNGTAALPNTTGMHVTGENNTIGGTTPASRNIISGNTSTGISMPGIHNVIQGNFIGTDVTGTVGLGNSPGIEIRVAWNNTIGGTVGTTPGGACTGACNLISGNNGYGISIRDTPASYNVIVGNFIGVDVTGMVAIPNTNGVDIAEASDNTVGGITPAARNVISGNTYVGVQIRSYSRRNIVQGNFIGTNSVGTGAVGNGLGLQIWNSSTENIIGGTLAGAGNVISGNSGNGVVIYDSARGNFVQGNFIGTASTGNTALGNGGYGIYIGNRGENDNMIGGTTANSSNRIAFNSGDGVALGSSAQLHNGILTNSIFSNGGLGIDLQDDGVTLNDVSDTDSGPNNRQNFPILTSVTVEGENIIVEGMLNSTPNTTFRLEFFANAICDPSSYGEGELYLDSAEVSTDGGGNATFTTSFAGIPLGYFITSTASDLNNNTSEFSPCQQVREAPTATPTNTPTATSTDTPTSTPTPAFPPPHPTRPTGPPFTPPPFRTPTNTPTATGPDSDFDSLVDEWELLYFGNLDQTADDDFDGDGCNNGCEQAYSTDPTRADSDADLLSDYDEIFVYGTDPLNADTEGDGLYDAEEVLFYSTDPWNADSDGDGLSDGDEVNIYGSHPANIDTDGDALSDGDEVNVFGTDPVNTDTDADGLNDGDEVNIYGSFPNNPDSDDNCPNDGEEVLAGFNPVLVDSDSDGISDCDEYMGGG